MKLYDGMPYWLIKNELWDYCNPLSRDVRTRVAVIGAGITGALVSHELSKAGFDCIVLDRRTPASGSSCASTALLQYEIDVPLCDMIRMMPAGDAVAAYRASLQAIGDLEELFGRAGVDAGFKRVPSVLYASDRRGLRMIRREYELRRKYALPTVYFDRGELKKKMSIDAGGALVNTVSAQIDPYAAATGLLRHSIDCHGLDLFSHTAVVRWQRRSDGYTLFTDRGRRIDCEYVVIASGFEAGAFLPRRLMRLTSTFAIVSEPVDEKYLWTGRSLIWETRQPYIYVRTDGNRIIVGGEDISSAGCRRRSLHLARKARALEVKFRSLYPDIPFRTEMAWAGTFSSTRDGLPVIGAFKGDPHMAFALGYGGNGITFSMIASRILARTFSGKADPSAHIFSPERRSI